MDYWDECISVAFDDAGITAMPEQIGIVAGWVQGAHENYGMAHGYDAIPDHRELEIERLKRELEKEQRKSVCDECGGNGWIMIPGPYHGSSSQCSTCRGDGRC